MADREKRFAGYGFAARFKDLLKGTNEQALSEYLGTSSSAFRQWINGYTLPTCENIYKLSEYFMCTTDYLLGLSEIRDPLKMKDIDVRSKIGKAMERYEGKKIRDAYRADDFMVDVLNSNQWFYSALSSMCDYVNYEVENADNLQTLLVNADRTITEYGSDELLGQFLLSAQNQIANVCKYLREKRQKCTAPDTAGKKKRKQKEASTNGDSN